MTRQPWWIALAALTACSQQPAPTQRPTPSPSPTPAIPAELQGRYGVTPAACEPNLSETTVRLLLTIGPDAIAFGVRQETVDRVTPRPGRIVFNTTDTSGDVVESRRYAFLVSPDRRQLTRVEAGRPDQVYTRCPDRPS